MVRFQIPDCDPRAVELLAQSLGASPVLAQVLVRRGLSDPATAQAFLDAADTHPLDAFDGLADAAARVLERVRDRTRITIHGDYDVDGVCSTAILVRALRRLGADVDWYLPDRAGDGYGLNIATVERLASRGTGLLITADCAITAVEEVAAARARGIEVIVTDHHTPRDDGRLPDTPIVHPTLGRYPCTQLCGAAVAHKLAQGLWQAAGRDPRELDEDLDLVALATIADVVALRGENRALAHRGLRALAVTLKPGLRALMTIARVDPSRVNERAVAFALAPRINAAGRLRRADAALELLLTEDPSRAAQIAQELDRVNSERRHIEQTIRFQAQAQLDALAAEAPRSAYVLAGERWHPGVIGIVASRLAERCRRPVVLISLQDGRGRGSGRSIEGFDLLGGLSACSQHLLRYGGHSAAAGLELDSAHVQALAEALDAHAAKVLSPEDLVEVERVDAIAPTREIGMSLAEELSALAPFGHGNPVVSLMVEDATLTDVRPMGEGKHARFTVRSGDAHARAVAFGRGTRLGVEEGERARATFALEVNEWGGVSEPRLVLRHAQPAAAGSALAAAQAQSGATEEATIDPCQIAGQARSMQLLIPT
jgi:single-stranded-DNA-specific exonuclease